MATPPSLRIDSLQAALDSAEIGQHPVEVHGALVGVICGGAVQSEDWHQPLLELMNDGQPLPQELTGLIQELAQDTVNRLQDAEFGFTLLLPEEEEALATRLEALSLWTQSFLTGIAIAQPALNQASEDVREVIKDLAEITQVDLNVSEDDECEQAFQELLEFVRMSAILCYSEFVLHQQSDAESQDKGILH
ncbi:UPF0149 family protein [Shewanella yunxiaonensis]|uniref:UPF0149 family protein n=1 Tax=Shewanella yunxiaonensis TaxID=2829809 RepID=A0ABX7YRE3_9GAMM|nr:MULTISPECIES: UPF0149 family protein [Shewanella]MDF0534019.1 UPF0149 family protein [Shewanella sp. A32]QUN05189.1 UPF0149 family protein [Shewanella yunxiaonensis]